MSKLKLSLEQLGVGTRLIAECTNGEKFHFAAIMASARVRHDFESEDAGWRYSFETEIDGVPVEVVYHTHVEPLRLAVVR